MIRAILVLAALLSPFLFPYPYTLLLSFIASLYVPPAALLSGIVTDLFYYVPAAGLPLGLIFGALLSVIALFVRRFIKARIIGG